MSISQASIEQLKQSIDIVDIISDYIVLKKQGSNYKALCPFHSEKTPSFVISPSKQMYYCFGCKAGGDVYKFVQDFNKISFTEAVEEVANKANFTLQYTSKKSNSYNSYRVLESIANYYKDCLEDEHIKYLKSRGVKLKTIKEWNIGYAPRSNKQIEFFNKNMLQKDELLKLGLLREKDNKIYAHFTERIMFPIENALGKTIGFSGRTLKENRAKYINSIDSQIFNKSRVLFGYSKAKDYIFKKRYIIIMEGQLDVILSHQVGIKTAVATQGTALTQFHLPLIKKANAKVILAYDGDNAGKEAAYKASLLLSKNSIDGKVVLFPANEDPASLVAKKEEEQLKKFLINGTDIIKYAISYIVKDFDITNPNQKNLALNSALDYLKSLNPIVANDYLPYLSKILNIDLKLISLNSKTYTTIKSATNNRASLEELLFYNMYKQPFLVDTAIDIVDFKVFKNQTIANALLQNTITKDLMHDILFKENLTLLSEENFIKVLRYFKRK